MNETGGAGLLRQSIGPSETDCEPLVVSLWSNSRLSNTYVGSEPAAPMVGDRCCLQAAVSSGWPLTDVGPESLRFRETHGGGTIAATA